MRYPAIGGLILYFLLISVALKALCAIRQITQALLYAVQVGRIAPSYELYFATSVSKMQMGMPPRRTVLFTQLVSMIAYQHVVKDVVPLAISVNKTMTALFVR